MKTSKTRRPFDVNAAIARAWDWCWAFNQQMLKEGGGIHGSDYHYLTASDLVNRVRADAAEVLADAEYGSFGRDTYRSGVRISTGGVDLLQLVRRWLFRQVDNGFLRCDSKGTSTRARYRPAKAPLSETEIKTKAAKLAKQQRGPTLHLRRVTKFGHVAHCIAERNAKKRAAGKFMYPSRRNWRNPIRDTYELDKVTCPSCLKAIREMKEELAELEGRGTPDAERIVLLKQRLHLIRIDDTEEIRD